MNYNTQIYVREALSGECISSVLINVLQTQAGKLGLIEQSSLKHTRLYIDQRHTQSTVVYLHELTNNLCECCYGTDGCYCFETNRQTVVELF